MERRASLIYGISIDDILEESAPNHFKRFMSLQRSAHGLYSPQYAVNLGRGIDS